MRLSKLGLRQHNEKKLIWSLQWRNTWPYFVARRFKQTKPTRRAVNVPTFLNKLINITGMNEQWVAARIKQKGDSKCIPWKNLKDLILAHLDTKKKFDVFVLSVYGLVVFPKALGNVDEAVTDLFD
ncbi:hypothetical protein Gotri_027584 [Gossypium trilobum]|uniref:Uncharacterized protein n=2 Tax=Gossypium trilobum TaxID=34281 RepID=A0A7J9FNG0_9ROSI|nr:hypothetical protein [Gossypium trilobum]